MTFTLMRFVVSLLGLLENRRFRMKVYVFRRITSEIVPHMRPSLISMKTLCYLAKIWSTLLPYRTGFDT